MSAQKFADLVGLVKALLYKDGIVETDRIATQFYRRRGGSLRDVIDYVEDRLPAVAKRLHETDDGMIFCPVTQYAVDLGFEKVAALGEDEIRLCVPGNGRGQRTAGLMRASGDNHAVHIAGWLRRLSVKEGIERAVGGELIVGLKQEVIDTAEAEVVIAAGEPVVLPEVLTLSGK